MMLLMSTTNTIPAANDETLARDLRALRIKLADCVTRLNAAEKNPDQAWMLEDLRYEYELLWSKVEAAEQATIRLERAA
jgi:hypothetical protein